MELRQVIFLPREHPGKTPEERKQNFQLPPENDATRVQKVVSQKSVVVLESDISPQEKWAEEAGYKATKGMRQVFTPNKDILEPFMQKFMHLLLMN